MVDDADNAPTGMMTTPAPPEPKAPARSVAAGAVFVIGLAILAGALVAQHLIAANEMRYQPTRTPDGQVLQGLQRDVSVLDDLLKQVGPTSMSIVGLGCCIGGAWFFSQRRRPLRTIAALLLSAPVVAFVHLGAPKETVKPPRSTQPLQDPAPTVTPWIDRADTAMRDMLNKPVNQQNIAGPILGITHPSGSNPSLTKWIVEKEGQTLSVTLDVAWKGGLIGTARTIQVVWRCNEAGPIRASVTKDDAPIGQDEASLKKLDDYFRTEVWPVLFNNTGGK